jgi:hypothetical protein
MVRARVLLTEAGLSADGINGHLESVGNALRQMIVFWLVLTTRQNLLSGNRRNLVKVRIVVLHRAVPHLCRAPQRWEGFVAAEIWSVGCWWARRCSS